MFRLGREDGLESGKAGMAFPCRFLAGMENGKRMDN